MKHLTTYRELTDSRKWLEKLFEEVKAEESPLSGGTRSFGIGGQAIHSLLDTKIAFGKLRSFNEPRSDQTESFVCLFCFLSDSSRSMPERSDRAKV